MTSTEWLSNALIEYWMMNGWLPYAGRKYVTAVIGFTGAQYNMYLRKLAKNHERSEMHIP